MPKYKETTSQRNAFNQFHFLTPDDERLKQAYHSCVSTYGGARWANIVDLYRTLINQELKKTTDPVEITRLKAERNRASQVRLRNRYTNNLQPGVRSSANSNPGSPDIAMVIQCINALKENENPISGVRKSHRYRKISREWKRRSPGDFLSPKGLRILINRLEKANMIAVNSNGLYYLVTPAAATTAPTPMPTTVTAPPHRPNSVEVITARSIPLPFDSDLGMMKVELAIVAADLNAKQAQLEKTQAALNAQEAELNKRVAALNAKRAQQEKTQAALEALQKELEARARTLASKRSALNERIRHQQEQEALLKTKLTAKVQRMRQFDKSLLARERDLAARETALKAKERDLAARETAVTEQERTLESILDTSVVDDTSNDDLSWIFQ